jgi:predicted nucleic acid-binding protein
MGLILDSTILIAGERRGETVKQVIQRVRAASGDIESALSVISIIGATALHLGFDVATLNLRHFHAIPDLKVVALG